MLGTLSRSKNATVSHPGTGKWCITPAAGIDATTTGVVAAPEYHNDTMRVGPAPGNSAHIEFDSASADCSAGQLEVKTFHINNQNATGDHYDVEFDNQAFFFIIP